MYRSFVASSRPPATLTRTVLALAALLLAPPAPAQVRFYGPDVFEGLKESVDVVDAHLRFLQAQDARGQALNYLNWTSRWAVGRQVLADGQTVAGNLSRTQFNLGGGFGELSRYSIFGGVNLDLTGFTGPAWTPIDNVANLAGGQSYLFIGGAIYDVQITYASKQNFVDASALNLDPWGNYRPVEPNGGPAYRPGTPWAISSPVAEEAWLVQVLTLYENRTGAFLSLSWGDVPVTGTRVDELGRLQGYYGGNETRLVDVRAHLQPLRLLTRSWLETIGVPSIGVRRIDAQVAKVFDDIEGKRGSANEARNQAAQAEPVEEEPSAPYEIDLGSDDVLGGGLRWRVVQRVRPEVVLRRAEVGYVEDHQLGDSVLRVGLQALLHRQGEGYEMAAEGFGLWSPTARSEGPSLLGPFSFGLSYSYNSPDTATFLPIPDAHVFGFQVLLGAPEAARPLVPLVRAVSERHGGGGWL